MKAFVIGYMTKMMKNDLTFWVIMPSLSCARFPLTLIEANGLGFSRPFQGRRSLGSGTRGIDLPIELLEGQPTLYQRSQ